MFEKITHKGWLGIFCLLATLILGSSASVKAVTIYGVTTSNQLIRFDSATPGTITNVGAIAGLKHFRH